MPVQPTFPGIYIEELPSSTHTITAAPTSITVFVGYSHPFKTRQFGKPIQPGAYRIHLESDTGNPIDDRLFWFDGKVFEEM